MSKAIWLLSAGFAALAAPAVASAQPTGIEDPNQPTSPSGTEQGAVTQTSQGADIVVTAQGRRQILQDVPLAVSAVSGEALQNSGATDIRQLNQLAPSLLVSSTGSEANGSARIRGIGTVGDNPGLESSVAVFIDGVYRSRSGIGLNELGEVERIEVLRGPQGTLFGRNASAGLIHIISRRPDFTFGGFAELSYGNYDHIRAAGAVTGPISDQLAFRIDGVYHRRDGFYTDVNNNTTINNRDRMFVRGQLLFEPNDALSIRLIGDYTNRDERCCAAVYVDQSMNPYIDGLIDPAQNNIVRVLRDMGQNMAAFSNPFSRNVYVTPGRGYGGETRDGGVSMEVNWDFGGATMTSITAWRDYRSTQGGDLDYGMVDILYRADDDTAGRSFETISQELRFTGSAFGDALNWLVGGYFAHEELQVTDNLKFGSQYGRFANCRLISGGGLAGFYDPTQVGCISPTGRAVLSGALAPAVPSPFGAAGPIIVASLDRLDSLRNLGSTLDVYNQRSRNWALFTHNIFRVTEQFDVTLGLRYTRESKRFDATFGNNNTVCTANQAALLPFVTNPGLAAVAQGLIGLSCQGNSTAELNGVSINDRRSESELTGTAVLSYRPNRDLLVYGSYSRGYKAGGFNLDRSALKAPVLPFSSFGGAQNLVGFLQFDPEIVDAFELGIKYSRGPLTLNAAMFRQHFSNFQLNTFNGTVFLVQNINGCSTDLAGADRDQNRFATAPNFNANAPATGACSPDNVTYGVVSQGVELEAAIRPFRDTQITAGLTWTDTSYRNNLVGNESGAPLDQALRRLPGRRLSNAPEIVFTSSLAWTPQLGNSGLTGLFYIDGRLTSDFNTGSDLFPQKEQDSYLVVNARIGIRGAQDRWALELWAQNLFDEDYAQVAFNTPFQEGAVGAPFTDPMFPGGRQIFSAFLAEPRTYGITGRFRF